MSLSRRQFLTTAGAAGGGLVLGGVGGYLVASDEAEAAAPGTGSVPFFGEHQAGILTPQQDRLHFASFDVTTSSARELRAMLEAWTIAAARIKVIGRDLLPSRAGDARDLDSASV